MTRSQASPYSIHPVGAGATMVLCAGGRSFLVVTMEDQDTMIVFEWKRVPDTRSGVWLARRQCHLMDPEMAVTGLLFGHPNFIDPFETLERNLRIAREASRMGQNVVKKDLKNRIRRSMAPVRKKSARR